VIEQWGKRYVPMIICFLQWSCPIVNYIHGLLQCFLGPFASSDQRIASINIFMFSYWSLSRRWWDIFLVLTWLVLQSTLPPMRHIQHDDLDPLGPNLQHIEGVLFGPTRSRNLIFLYFSQLKKKYDKSH
jgi:hypothetical protein